MGGGGGGGAGRGGGGAAKWNLKKNCALGGCGLNRPTVSYVGRPPASPGGPPPHIKKEFYGNKSVKVLW